MSRLNDSNLPFSLLQFYSTSPYACSYLPGERAISKVATPTHLVTTEIYAELVRSGFRRSGIFTYRPDCTHCNACVPVRVATERFIPNRTQKRTARTHSTLQAQSLPLRFDEAHYRLYLRYQAARHAGGGMDEDNNEQYAHFLLQSRVDSWLIEFTENGVLRMVSIVDVLDDGLSSVYTFFDPDVPNASYGTYNILWQIDQCRTNMLPYLYLGYWIHASHKMAYKANFRPIEGLLDGQWQAFDPADPRFQRAG